jgi:hypothetical protein
VAVLFPAHGARPVFLWREGGGGAPLVGLHPPNTRRWVVGPVRRLGRGAAPPARP